MENIENTTIAENETTENLINIIAKKDQEIEQLKAETNYYKELFKREQLKKYAKSSEKINPNQLMLFNEVEIESVKKTEEISTEEVLTIRKKKKSKSGKGFENLPIEEIIYTLSDKDQICPKCNSKLHEMKTEIRKELKVIPASIKVIHHIKQIYACRKCDVEGTTGTIITSPSPKPALPGSFASSSILAFTIDQKYSLALPLYRQESKFRNLGYEISRQNLANWTIKASNRWLKIIYNRMYEYLLKEPIIHADETTLNVLDEKNNKKNYMWLYTSATNGNKQICIFDYQKSRSKNHPINFLNNYSGYLQTDGYQAYESVKNVYLIGCLAHARRYFKEALDAAPKDSKIAKSKSSEGLSFFSRIYKIDKEIRKLDPVEKFSQRIEKIEPIMIEFYAWLENESKKTLPKSLLGKAINYNLRQWPKLIGTLCDGRLDLDNNKALYTYYYYPHLLLKVA